MAEGEKGSFVEYSGGGDDEGMLGLVRAREVADKAQAI